jgi:putative tricarboxylic transport membrane protein
MRHQDTLIGVVLLALCAIVYWLTTGFTEVPAMLSQNVPPTFFPRLVLGVVAALSIVLIFNGLRRSPDVTARISPAVLVTASIIVLAGVLVGILGTLPTLSFIAITIPLAWGERRLRPIAILAIGLPAGIYLVFSVALGIRFPPGMLLDGFL